MPSPEDYEKVTDNISAGKFKTALQYLTPLLETEPENVGLLLDAGFIHANLDEFDTSIEYYQKVIDLAPHNPAGYTGLGFVYKILEQHDKRLEMFLEAIKHSPNNALVFFELGETYLELDRYQAALEAFLNALKFGGPETEPETLMRIAQTYLGLEAYTKCLETCNNILKKHSTLKTVHYIMAGAEASQDHLKKAVEHLDIYLAFNPDDEDAREMLENIKDELNHNT